MDNLTHSLVGAVLGQTGLKKKTGLGMATLIIAANIPDIDAFAVLLGGHQHLAFRRGITHGPIAMLVLPLILAVIMTWFDGWQTRRGTRPAARLPLHKGWLLALAYIGTLSHPALDYLNNYGIRLLEPFSSKWFYGDTLFIIDIWIWAVLGISLWLSLQKEKQGDAGWKRPAVAACIAVIAYIGANGLITNRAEQLTAADIAKMRGQPAELVVANNVPVAFWLRQMIWRGQGQIGSGSYNMLASGNGVTLNNDMRADRMEDVDWTKLQQSNPDFAPFLFWARMPYVRIEPDDGVSTVALTDQRFDSSLIGDRFVVREILSTEK